MEIKDLLKARRKEASLTQQELSNLVGISRSSIALYETGKSNPTMEVLVQLSKVLDIDINEIKQPLGAEVAESEAVYRTVSSTTAIKRIAELMTRIERNQDIILRVGKEARRSARAIQAAQEEIKQLLGWQSAAGENLSDGG